jgi:uncharacterized protein
LPLTPTYPGVYVEELPSSVHTISGVSTSNTAFIDFFERGPIDSAVQISTFTDFERIFGGLDKRSEASYQLMQYYLNGGQTAFVVRVAPPDAVVANVDLLEQGLVIPGTATSSILPDLLPSDPVELAAGDQQQFVATIPGSANWTIKLASSPPPSSPPVSKIDFGLIDPKSGLYVAPKTIASAMSVMVTAKGIRDCSIVATAVIQLMPVSIAIVAPAMPITLGPGETFNFKAETAGTTKTVVAWSVSGPGSIDTYGVYTYPANLSSPPVTLPTSVAVAATLIVGKVTITASQEVTLVAVHVSPDTAKVAVNQSLLLTANCASGVTDDQMTWSFDPPAAAPTAIPSGRTCCYKPPSSYPVTSPKDVTVMVTVNGVTSAAAITVLPQYTVEITSADNETEVEVGDDLQLTAKTWGDPSGAVSWKASAGTITQQGLYQAPATLPNPTSHLMVTITATSANDTSDFPQQSTTVLTIAPAQSRFRVKASSPGAWGNQLQVAAIAPRTPNPAKPTFNLQFQEVDANGNVLRTEVHTALTYDPDDPKYAVSTINSESQMAQFVDFGEDYPAPFLQTGTDLIFQTLTGGEDGEFVDDQMANALIQQVQDDSALLSSIAPNLFNILCLPATANLDDAAAGVVLGEAQKYCQDKRAFLIIDIPPSEEVSLPTQMVTWFESHLTDLSLAMGCAAVYYPRLDIADPLNNFRTREIGSSGTMAGIYASSDVNRGVWKAPAGTQAIVAGANPAYVMKDADNGILNPLGINAIRSFPVYGNLSWGARTVQGADEIASQWKYIPVRRLAQYIENSLYQGLKWAVFEPNDTPLWGDMVLNVNAFMGDLFRQHAFQGSSPKDAYFVKCDASTTTQYDIDRGIVNIVVGFAPLKPAEFVVIQIQQIAGQSA